METPTSAKFEIKNKMADSCFAISNQSNVEQLKEKFLKPKYFENKTDLVESLAELIDRTESQPEN